MISGAWRHFLGHSNGLTPYVPPSNQESSFDTDNMNTKHDIHKQYCDTVDPLILHTKYASRLLQRNNQMFSTPVCLGKVRRRGYLAQNRLAKFIEESLVRVSAGHTLL
jgi:hypothetical protein